MKRIRYLSLLLVLLCGTTAWAQDDPFDPASPAEPGQIVEKYKLTLVADPADAASSLTGGGKYVSGTSVTLKTTAASGWKFVNWTNENGETVTSPYTTKADRETLTAHFEFAPDSPTEPGEIAENVRYWLTLAVEEGGTASGGGRYLVGTQNTVTASANAGYEFVGWYDSDGETCLTTNKSYKVTMVRGGMTLLAKFNYTPDSPDEPGEIKEPHKVVLKVEEGGTASANPSRLVEGETTTIRAYANSGYDWDGWYRNGILYTNSEEFVYTMGNSNVEFEARFVFNPDNPNEPSMPQAKQYAFYLMNIIGRPGDTVHFPIYLTSQAIAKDMDFQLTFPTELVPTNVTTPTLADAASAYTVTCTEGSGAEEGQTAYVYTLTGGELAEGNVALLTFDIVIPSTQETGKGYPVYINQITVNNTDDEPQPASARHGRVSVYKNGDANGDNDINIADVVCIVNHVVNKPMLVFINEVANVNNDEGVDIADAVRVVNLIVGKTSSLSRPTVRKWDDKEPQ